MHKRWREGFKKQVLILQGDWTGEKGNPEKYSVNGISKKKKNMKSFQLPAFTHYKTNPSALNSEQFDTSSN